MRRRVLDTPHEEMNVEGRKVRRRRVAWGVTGSGDKLVETLDVMKIVKRRYRDDVEIKVYLSKAGEQVVKYYRLLDDLEENFSRIIVELGPNSPFLAGELQLGRFEFLLIAPATSNTVAKISTGIEDSLLSNSAAMAMKANIPVYVFPSDYREGVIVTKLPDGQELKLRIRRGDVENVEKLDRMEGVHTLESSEEIHQVFTKHFSH